MALEDANAAAWGEGPPLPRPSTSSAPEDPAARCEGTRQPAGAGHGGDGAEQQVGRAKQQAVRRGPFAAVACPAYGSGFLEEMGARRPPPRQGQGGCPCYRSGARGGDEAQDGERATVLATSNGEEDSGAGLSAAAAHR